MIRHLYCLLFGLIILGSTGFGRSMDRFVQEKSSPVIHRSLTAFITAATADSVPVWIFFTDKGIHSLTDLTEASRTVQLPERTLRRRARGSVNPGVDLYDLPVKESYIDSLLFYGFTRRHTSAWLNAVSGYISRKNLEEVADLIFVQEIRLLPHRSVRHEITVQSAEPGKSYRESHLLNYGNSATQLEMINVPGLHDLGLSGNGILICLLDTGFDLQHNALQSVNVTARYDFVDQDSIVSDEPGKDSDNQDDHGTKVLSVIGGNCSGELYGTAFGASYLLGKTEIQDLEVVIEEDNWVACIEWAERLGADIASSSLVYNDWYDYKDMDGNTAITTRVADIAVARGMIVTVSAGNERNSEWHYICAPADADSVITVGAVDKKGILASFSSAGPTADGRIKPDVVAMGKAVVAVNTDNPSTFSSVDGTSYSNPLIAGVCALLLEAHPHWTPMQIREALIRTAARTDSPDNNYGWGLVDALAALHYRQPGDVNGDDLLNTDDVNLIAQFILATIQPDADTFKQADLNNDSLLDIRDLVLLINKLPPLPVR
ncbi:MAG TPA: S8 family serine peptidase [bacterium]|nr:S8 family serine peptidase [bacterium]HPN46162.1 S8 family serine peptidase [bacterium]